MAAERAPSVPATNDTVGTGRAALARLRRFGGDSLVRDMRAIFVEDAPLRLRAARAGALAGDLGAVRLATHSLKSSCAQFGAMRAAALCGEAEQAALRGDVAPLSALLDGIERELADFHRWLDRELAATDEEWERTSRRERR